MEKEQQEVKKKLFDLSSIIGIICLYIKLFTYSNPWSKNIAPMKASYISAIIAFLFPFALPG